MARLVEVLHVERVIPHLIDRGAIEVGRTHFEFDDENNGPADHHRIDAATHARNVELEKQESGEAGELLFQQGNLREPRFRLLPEPPRSRNCSSDAR